MGHFDSNDFDIRYFHDGYEGLVGGADFGYPMKMPIVPTIIEKKLIGKITANIIRPLQFSGKFNPVIIKPMEKDYDFNPTIIKEMISEGLLKAYLILKSINIDLDMYFLKEFSLKELFDIVSVFKRFRASKPQN